MPARLVYVQSKGLAALIPFWGGSKQNPPFALLPGFLFSDPYKSNLLTFPKTEIPTFRPGFCFAESKGFEPLVPFETGQRFSRPPRSTTPATLRAQN